MTTDTHNTDRLCELFRDWCERYGLADTVEALGLDAQGLLDHDGRKGWPILSSQQRTWLADFVETFGGVQSLEDVAATCRAHGAPEDVVAAILAEAAGAAERFALRHCPA